MQVPFLGLIGLSSIGKAASDGVDYTSDVLGRFLLWWRLSLTLLWLLSLSASVFFSSFVCFLVSVLLLLMSSGSWSYLVVVWSLNKLG